MIKLKKQKNKNFSKSIILIWLCVILLLIYTVSRVLAVFYSEQNGKVEIKKGKWHVTINETDITNGTDLQFDINNIQIKESEHVKPGTMAPGLKGNFSIVINPEDTDVSIRYEIDFNDEQLNTNNMTVKSIKEVRKDNELIRIGLNRYCRNYHFR